MRIVRFVGVVGAMLAMSLVLAGPAAANIGISGSLSLPSAVAVGQTGQMGSITVTNTNTAPNNTESNTLTALQLTPSCAVAGTVASICSSPDPGVFSISSTATGAAGTACAGQTFNVSAPDVNGTVTFTVVGGTVVVPPPDGVPGHNQCKIDFTFSVLKMPALDSNAGIAGVQTRANVAASLTGNISGLTVTSRPSLEITVVKATPTIATQASQNTVAGTIADTATVTGVVGVATPTGTVTFSAFGPNNATCAGAPFASSTNTLAAGTATSTSFPVTLPGTYRFVAVYNGDGNYSPVTSLCNAANESVVVVAAARAPVADFDGDGDTDRSVFRAGAWYAEGQATAFLGMSGDIPVPADYDGNGTTNRAVYRNGAWYVDGQATVFLGVAGDIPVPGDYDGNGTVDRAVFRPSVGGWYVNGQGTVFLGLSGDIPVPGDYDGNGTTDRGIWRPSVGGWYVQSQATVFLGINGDIPLPLPQAIYRAFF